MDVLFILSRYRLMVQSFEEFNQQYSRWMMSNPRNANTQRKFVYRKQRKIHLGLFRPLAKPITPPQKARSSLCSTTFR